MLFLCRDHPDIPMGRLQEKPAPGAEQSKGRAWELRDEGVVVARVPLWAPWHQLICAWRRSNYSYLQPEPGLSWADAGPSARSHSLQEGFLRAVRTGGAREAVFSTTCPRPSTSTCFHRLEHRRGEAVSGQSRVSVAVAFSRQVGTGLLSQTRGRWRPAVPLAAAVLRIPPLTALRLPHLPSNE